MRLPLALTASIAAAALAAPSFAAPTFTADQIAAAKAGVQQMSQLNVIVFGDATDSSEIEGKAWVGGNLSMAGNVGFGAHANGQSFAPSSTATLTVGGNASDGNGVHIANGIGEASVTANIGGNSSKNYFDNGYGSLGANPTLNAGGTITGLNGTGVGNANVAGLQTTIGNQTAALKTDLTTLSQVLASYSSNTTFNTSDPNNLSFTTTTAQLLVANISGSSLSSGGLALPTLKAGQILVVNVSGNDLKMGVNPLGSGAGTADDQNVIWNFIGTGTMTFQTQWDGSILAPNATVANSSQLNGSLVAAALSSTAEVHLGTFNGSTDTLFSAAAVAAVPEPASWAMMLAGFGVIGGALRGQRRRGLATIG